MGFGCGGENMAELWFADGACGQVGSRVNKLGDVEKDILHRGMGAGV